MFCRSVYSSSSPPQQLVIFARRKTSKRDWKHDSVEGAFVTLVFVGPGLVTNLDCGLRVETIATVWTQETRARDIFICVAEK